MRCFLKLSVIIFLDISLAACETSPTNAGQSTYPQQVESNTFLIGGYNTQDAIKGATLHCQEMGRRMEMIQLIPSTNSLRATITYSCSLRPIDWELK